MNSPSVLRVLCMTLTMALVSAYGGWQSEYQQPFTMECPYYKYTYTFIAYLRSVHDNSMEDRVWNYGCVNIAKGSESRNCSWTDNYINELDQPMFFNCPSNTAMTGIKGVFQGPYRDRQFKVKCCVMWQANTNSQMHLQGCELSEPQNQFDGPLDFAASGNRVLTGMFSFHSNPYEDRIFRFETCKAV